MIRSAQVKAAVKVNAEKLLFNWQLGRDLLKKKAEEHWGAGVVVLKENYDFGFAKAGKLTTESNESPLKNKPMFIGLRTYVRFTTWK